LGVQVLEGAEAAPRQEVPFYISEGPLDPALSIRVAHAVGAESEARVRANAAISGAITASLPAPAATMTLVLSMSDGTVRKCSFTVPPAIPARVAFKIDYQTGVVTVALVNVDRFDRVTLEFHNKDIEAPMLEDLVRLILGRDSSFLRRAPLAGMRRSSAGTTAEVPASPIPPGGSLF